ncbi:hypothetical protein MCC93_26990 [Morococcus cerebrosus]|uniref:Uncharacterized protein n=1 Tax=Morococcus cerebrosus TaxID=1056807 RepID=A0A0C1EAK5_9NEIS|nr:hypothetical protein MCC93_26990 [Morococcus cerebrosus]
MRFESFQTTFFVENNGRHYKGFDVQRSSEKVSDDLRFPSGRQVISCFLYRNRPSLL